MGVCNRSKKRLEDKITHILAGIDQNDTDDDRGWRETSKGDEFGKNKLAEVICAIRSQME